MSSKEYSVEITGRTLRLETGKLAQQAGGSVTVSYGESVVLATACVSSKAREDLDFFPLTVDYEERLYAAGKIPGSFFRREGRPSQDAILASRLTDRPIRPLFPKGFKHEVQVVLTVLSADQENDPDILGIIGASAALSMSEAPFAGPLSACRIGYMDGQLVVNPTLAQLQTSKLDIVVAGTKNAVMMVEAGASEVPEEVLIEAIKLAQITNAEIIEIQEQLVRDAGKSKIPFEPVSPLTPELEKVITSAIGSKLETLLSKANTKQEWEGTLAALEDEAVEKVGEAHESSKVKAAYQAMVKAAVRKNILDKGWRPDGRDPKTIRPITCEVGVLPRTHGSGLFTRGETQVLTVTTLGSVGDEQKIDSIGIEESKRFMHHYNFPPFSVGEVRRMGGPGRREIGHGALVERAIAPVIPSEEEFPYTIRLVSEVLSSNGSTSQASTCASSLSLMDAGVPIKTPVAGVAMGLVMGKDGKFTVLTDIAGTEDALGDMDFKVAGTAEGVTALQMDIKVQGINYQVMETALRQAKEGRLFILDKMLSTISKNRPELSRYAPRMIRITINPEKIGAVIGPGGKTIRSIIEQTGASIDVEDDGTVFIGSSSEESTKKAIERIEGLTKEAEVGSIYNGKVSRIVDFGAFIEILPGKEGLCRTEELADHPIQRPEDVIKVGDEIMVMVIEVDRMGRINVSRRAVTEGLQKAGARVREAQASRRPMGGGFRGGPPRGPGGFRPGGPPRGDRRPGSFGGDR